MVDRKRTDQQNISHRSAVKSEVMTVTDGRMDGTGGTDSGSNFETRQVESAQRTKTKRRTLALGLGLFLFAVYLFTYRGGFHSIDEVSIFATTESLVKFGRFNTDQIAWTQWTTSQAEAQGFFGRGGHVYSKKGLGLSLAQAPLYWLGLVLPGLGMLQTVSLLNALITAATGLLVMMFIHRLNFSITTAVITALLYGLATIAFVYTKYLFSEPLAGFLLLMAAYMLLAFKQEGGLHHLILAGLAAGGSVLTRANNLFLLPIFGLYLLWVIYDQATESATSTAHQPNPAQGGPAKQSRKNGPRTVSLRRLAAHSIRPITVFVLSIAFSGAVLMGYNAIRSGHPLQTGYDLTLFSPNVLLGLYKLLFSPLRGLFVYSPVLLLSLPGWWLLRQRRPAEAWLFAGLAGVTVGLFSAWSSGEGLSWGSRFLIPVVPFFAICLAPVGQLSMSNEQLTNAPSRLSTAGLYILRFTFSVLLLISLVIQILGVIINPWVYLAQLQADFGGEFFLENTDALYDFGYTQILGQLQTGSLTNSDLAWWQPWGFDGRAFGLGLALLLFCGWLLWRRMIGQTQEKLTARLTYTALPLAIGVSYLLLARYFVTDRQFGPPDEPYAQALSVAAEQAGKNDVIVTVHDTHYHVAMNRFKARVPIIGMARQRWPLPATALPLLETATAGQQTRLITVGFPPAAPDNAAEQWLSLNTFKASDTWFDDVRLVDYGTTMPATSRPIDIHLGEAIRLVEVNLTESLRPGEPLPVEFIWLPISQPQVDYNLFLQLLDAEGMLVAQHDNPPGGGYAPTSSWQPNRSIRDRHALILPSDLPPATYRLIAGLYDPHTGERLAGANDADFVELGQIRVESSR